MTGTDQSTDAPQSYNPFEYRCPNCDGKITIILPPTPRHCPWCGVEVDF